MRLASAERQLIRSSLYLLDHELVLNDVMLSSWHEYFQHKEHITAACAREMIAKDLAQQNMQRKAAKWTLHNG